MDKQNKAETNSQKEQTDGCQKLRGVEGWVRKVKGNKRCKLLAIK